MTRDVDLEITGSPEGLEAALTKAKSAVRGAVGDMQGAFGQLQAAVGKVQGIMLAFTAALGGGAAFKAAVDSTVNLTKESELLGRSLGIGASQASVLKLALGDVYATQDQLTAATQKVAQILNTDEQAFTRLGVATRDSNGNFRSTLDILLDVNQRLGNLKEGTDRNVAGVQIFGKAWSSIAPLLGLTNDAMDAATAKGRELGLVLGKEDVEATDKYRAALNDAGDVMDGLQKVVGDALMPTLTEMAQWFAEIGPQAVKLFRSAIAGITETIITVEATFTGFGAAAASIADQLVAVFTALGRVISLSLRGDFDGAKAAWEKGMAALDAIAVAADERRIAREEETARRVAAAWEQARNPKFTALDPPKDGNRNKGTAESSKSQMTGWQTGLDEAKAAWSEQQRLEGSFREFSKAQEVAYWQGILSTQRVGTQEQLAIRSKVAQLQLAMDKEKFSAEIENLKTEQAAFRDDGEARLAIAREISERMRAAYGEDSKEYAASRRDVITAEQQVAAEVLRIRQDTIARGAEIVLSGVDADEDAAQERVALQLETAGELLAQEEEFENRRYEVRRQALEQMKQAEMESGINDPEAQARLQAQIEELDAQHQARLREIRARLAVEARKEWASALNQMQGGFKSAIAGMLKGTVTFADGMKQMASTVMGAVIDMIAQIAAKILVSQIAQLIGVKTTAASTIAARAAEAGAAGTASFAGAPWPINMGAPAFGLAMAAAAGSFAAGLSASGGFDVPSGINPVTQLHQREMVLPADLADTVRSMAGGAGGGGSPGQIHIHAVDARGVQRLLSDPRHAQALIKSLRTATRLHRPHF